MPWKKSKTIIVPEKDNAKAGDMKQFHNPRKKIVGSPQQEAIWEEMVNGERNITGEALAGTGKTTTGVEGVTRIGRKKRTAMVAFNKPIADDLQRRVPEGVVACTMHSLGNTAVRKAFGSKTDGRKLDYILREIIAGDVRADLEWNQIELKKVCESLVQLSKNTLAGGNGLTPEDTDYQAIIDHFGIDIPARVSENEVFQTTSEALQKCFEETEIIDFDDMIWFPVVHQLSGEKYDMLLVDEAQDLNRCRQQLCLQSCDRMMIIGDKHQAIYGFTGSDTESMQTMGKALGSQPRGHVSLPLTVSRRCPKSHVEMAKKIVPEFEAMPDACEGTIGNLEFKELLTEAKPGDLMICRMNAPVCQAAFKLLSQRKKVRIQGRDIGNGIIALIRKSKKDTVTDLLRWLTAWRDREEDRLRKRQRGSQDTAVQSLNDRFECIVAFTAGCSTTAEMVKVIDQTFSDAEGDQSFITLSSIHRAKGLEADRVMVLCPEILPAPWAKQQWEKEQEYNLRYVALTRSKRDMFFVPDWRRRHDVDTRAETVLV